MANSDTLEQEFIATAKQAGSKLNKLDKAGTGILIGVLSGLGMIFGGLLATSIAPVVAPIVAVTGACFLFVAGPVSVVHKLADENAWRQKEDAIRAIIKLRQVKIPSPEAGEMYGSLERMARDRHSSLRS